MNKSKRMLAGTALAGALLLGACGGSVEASGDVTKGPAGGDAVKLVAEDNEFRPSTLRAKAGEEITVEVTNRGDAAHNFVVGDMDLSTGTIEPGGVATATFEMPGAKTEFVCSFHPGMKGELVPEEA
ncbi:MAG TPA: cupredoxin domain-containing protein [Actinomycetota bacterium]|nr:cupredoxin domain-containing protein [Actinomycetota bacterium]